MRIGASGWLAGMTALLMAAAKAPTPADLQGAAPQGEPGSPGVPAESAPGELTGAVEWASPEGVRVSVSGAPDVRLRMKPRTIVVVDGQMATVDDVHEGDSVRALYRDVQGQPIAILLDVKTNAQARQEAK